MRNRLPVDECKDCKRMGNRLRYIAAHAILDRLVAEWIEANPNVYPSKNSVIDLMRWSYQRIVCGENKKGGGN